MSGASGESPRGGPESAPEAPGGGGGARRAASVTLSPRQGEEDTSALMDPANQSLADALRITFRLVQLAMVVLGVLYLISGFQSVKENEQAIRLLFGARDSEQVDPGFRFSYPAPLGELVKVDTGQVDIDLSSDFWVAVDERAKDTPIEKLPPTQKLNPEREGSVLTGDGNVAHTRWKITYSRDPAKVALYAENVLPGDKGSNEQGIVSAAVKRGVVQAIAQVTIDELLKQAPGEAGSIASRAKQIAQGVLDRLKTGIRIDKLLLTEKMPPLNVRAQFVQVQSSESEANRLRDLADSERKTRLAKTAGSAAGPLIELIARYEVAVEKKDAAAKDLYLAAITDVLEGRAAKAGDLEFAADLVSGEVTTLLSGARQYRADNVNRARSDLSRFQAKLSQFKTSPQVLVNREWADSMRVFLDHDFVQVMLAPKGTGTMVLKINSDPLIIKDLEQKRKEIELANARKQREKDRKKDEFKLPDAIKATPN